MDLSKLPKFSETPQPPRNDAADATNTPSSSPPINYATADPLTGSGPEAWISIAFGVIMLFLYPRLWQYLLTTNFTWTFTDPNGQPLPYTQTVYFWGDFAITIFALVLIVEGLVIGFFRKWPFIMLACALTVLAVLINLAYLVWMMSQGYAFQFLPAIAVAFGIYIAWWQWRLLQITSQRRGIGYA